MRKRHQAILRLESMEDRVVLSAVGSNLTASATAEVHKLGVDLRHAVKSLQHDPNSLSQGHTNQASHTQPRNHHAHSHHTTKNLYGLPNFKL